VALICDTGPLYAAIDRADRDHDVCAELLVGSSEQLLVPAPVIVELDWLVGTRLSQEPFLAFLADFVEGRIGVVDLVHADYVRAREVLHRYGDLKLGFVDAAIFAIVERLGERKLATLDHRHFGTMRPRHVDALELLPSSLN
jgi:predicted nucleic acid-binding protein